MPTYEYACGLCGHKMEVFQSILAERLVNCPACSKDGLRRLIGTGAGLIFKGTGFYQTDYKNKPEAKSENSSSEGSKADAPAAGNNSSSKPSAEPAKSGAASNNAGKSAD